MTNNSNGAFNACVVDGESTVDEQLQPGAGVKRSVSSDSNDNTNIAKPSGKRIKMG